MPRRRRGSSARDILYWNFRNLFLSSVVNFGTFAFSWKTLIQRPVCHGVLVPGGIPRRTWEGKR